MALDVDQFDAFDPASQMLARGGTRFETNSAANGLVGLFAVKRRGKLMAVMAPPGPTSRYLNCKRPS